MKEEIIKAIDNIRHILDSAYDHLDGHSVNLYDARMKVDEARTELAYLEKLLSKLYEG